MQKFSTFKFLPDLLCDITVGLTFANFLMKSTTRELADVLPLPTPTVEGNEGGKEEEEEEGEEGTVGMRAVVNFRQVLSTWLLAELQCVAVAVCCSVMQRVVVCCSVLAELQLALQCTAIHCNTLQQPATVVGSRQGVLYI